MKTRRLSSILMSAYLSAMLASSLAPMAGNITLAGTVNPSAAEAAFRQALIGTQNAGWTYAAADVPAPEPQIVVARATTLSEPMSDELLARILKVVGNSKKPGSIPANVCVLFQLCDGTDKLPTRQVQTDKPKGTYLFMKWDNSSQDIVVGRKMDDGSIEFYLTDKTRKLRAAVIAEETGAKIVLNETVAAKYEAALAHLAREAADLPPVGTTVAAAGS